MLSSSFDLSTCFLAALHAIDSMSKRPLDQKSTVRKRSSLKRPATKQTPQIPANTEATMHDSGNASILRCSDAAVQPDAATEHISIAWLSTSDDVTLIAIFEHFAYCYVAMPMVGTCKRIFNTWTRKRRQLALEILTNLLSWLQYRLSWLHSAKLISRDDGTVAIRNILLPLRDIESLIR